MRSRVGWMACSIRCMNGTLHQPNDRNVVTRFEVDRDGQLDKLAPPQQFIAPGTLLAAIELLVLGGVAMAHPRVPEEGNSGQRSWDWLICGLKRLTPKFWSSSVESLHIMIVVEGKRIWLVPARCCRTFEELKITYKAQCANIATMRWRSPRRCIIYCAECEHSTP